MGCSCDNCGCTGSENVVQLIGKEGPAGPAGATPSINSGSTTTLAPGSPATVTLVAEGNNSYHFDFGIPEGADGTNGTSGTNGWSPILAVVSDGERRVLQIVSWTGGTGTPPSSTDQFLGSVGIVNTAAAAVDIRGSAAAAGASMPIGSSMEYGGVSDPNPVSGSFTGATWMIEDGRELSRSTYYILFNIIGTRFGAGNGTTTFNIPNSYGRVTFGFDTTTDFNAVGKTGGAKTKTLAANNLPVTSPWALIDPGHGHSVNNGTSQLRFTGSGGSNIVNQGSNGWNGTTVSVNNNKSDVSLGSNTGGAQSFAILPPYIVKHKIIRVL